MEREYHHSELGLAVWCGIILVMAGAATLVMASRVGLAVLAVGVAWLIISCVRDRRRSSHTVS